MDNQEQPTQPEQPTTEPVAQTQPAEETVVPVSEQPVPQPAQPVQPEKTPEQLFLDRYHGLCIETGFELSIEPKLILDAKGFYDLTKFTIAVTVGKKG